MKTVGKRLARLVMTLIALGLFLVAGLAITSALASIAFGGLLRRLGGYEVITGSVLAIGMGVSLLKARPKLSISTPPGNQEKPDVNDQAATAESSELE